MPKSDQIRSWLPLAILLIALASVFALGGGDRDYLHRWRGTHNELTAKNMAIAENLSPKHNFLLTTRIWRDDGGGFRYDSYGRFPIGGYALIKLAILPFGGDLSAKLLAARLLMLLMFCGAAVFAYLTVARIAGNRWIALAAVALAFSPLYALYYADAVAGETSMDLFGVMLVFHGVVVFAQEGRFRQLLLKVCAALLMGWHVYALIMPFAVLGFGGEALALVRSSFAGGGGGIRAALATLPALARSRFIALAAVSILFGSALLALNFANEYAAYGGKRSFRDLPSVGSMMTRLGLTGAVENPSDAAPGDFLRRQLHRAGVASAPYAVAGFAGSEYESPPLDMSTASFGWTAWGVAAAIAALAALALVPRRFRLPMACLALTGFVWALAARGNAHFGPHSHEGLFHVGLPLALWSGALLGARRLPGARLGGAPSVGITALAALAAAVFALSALHAARIKPDADTAKQSREIMADMSAVRESAKPGKRVIVSPEARRLGRREGNSVSAMRYYLGGMYWENAALDSPPANADYALSRYRNEEFNLLTPDNRRAFLYESIDLDELYRAERRRIESSPPDAEAVFDVYLAERGLAYLKSPCVWETDAGGDRPFFLRLHPVGGEARPDRYFPFSHWGAVFDDVCMMVVDLPDIPIAAIRTEQLSPDGRLWGADIFPPPSAETLALYEMEYQAVAEGGELVARSGFDLYLDADGGALSYLKQPCTEDDVRGRFWLSVHPADAADLPENRRGIGHESLNFDFVPPLGAVFNGKCMATRQLPDYEIAKIETGQDAPGVGRVWSATVSVGD